MLVKDCMTRHPIMAPPTMPAAEAQQLMKDNRIRHLPVVGDGKRLLGILTQMDLTLDPGQLGSLDVWEITRHLSRVTVRQLMSPADAVVTITPERTIERAAQQMIQHKIGCLPVIEGDGVVVGILTETDLLNAFQLMLGLPSEGVRVTVRMLDRQGEFAKLSKILGEQGWGVMGIGTFPTPRHEGYYDAVVKISHVTPQEVMDVLNGIPDQKVVDIREAA